MLTTIGIAIPYSSANAYMQSGVYWWQGASANILGATIPANWDSDNGQVPDYSGSLTGIGPYSSLPRFRFNSRLT